MLGQFVNQNMHLKKEGDLFCNNSTYLYFMQDYMAEKKINPRLSYQYLMVVRVEIDINSRW